jgi:hypothetical protein
MGNFEYINPPKVSDDSINRASNEIEYLKQIIRNIMMGKQ